MDKEEIVALLALFKEASLNKDRSWIASLMEANKRRVPGQRWIDSSGKLSADADVYKQGLLQCLEAHTRLDLIAKRTRTADSGCVLAIGAAHLDFYADYREDQIHNVDKIGDLRFAVGGTMFNIASNLVQSGIPVSLFTSLRRRSAMTQLILERCSMLNIDISYVLLTNTSVESGFAAQRENGRLVSAVTSTTLDRETFDDALLEEAIDRCRFVVLDCNLSEGQIKQVTKMAVRHGRKSVLAAVSQAKASRILAAWRDDGALTLEAVTLNESEAIRVFSHLVLDRQASSKDICNIAGARNVVVTRAEQGFTVYSFDSGVQQYSAPNVNGIASSSGAGDGVCAAICDCLFRKGRLDWKVIATNVDTLVSRILTTTDATVAAGASMDELRDVVPVVDVNRENHHSDDYESILWEGIPYQFTKTQAECVRVLWEAWEKGTPEVRHEKIVAKLIDHAVEVEEQLKSSLRMSQIFKRNNAWRTIIVPGERKGNYRLLSTQHSEIRRQSDR